MLSLIHILVAFDAGERIHQGLIADHKANSPAGHVIAFRQGKELDGDIPRAGHLHDGGRFPVSYTHLVSVITIEKLHKHTCNKSSGQTYTQRTGLISLLYRRPYTSALLLRHVT